jgi:hypothetical protein
VSVIGWISSLFKSPEQLEIEALEGRVRKGLLETQLGLLGDLVDPREPVIDDLSFIGGTVWGDLGAPYLDHRGRGEAIPVYMNEGQLKLLRDHSRRLCALNEFALNAMGNRVGYVCGRGYGYKLARKTRHGEPPPQGPDPLVAQGQAVLDEFLARTRWGEREQETVYRCDEDGETFIRLFHVGDGRTEARYVEPEHVRGHGNPDPRASFGIVTEHDDVENVLAYMIAEDPYLSLETTEVDADDVVHFKLNTRGSAKRGLPTFHPVRKNLQRAETLLRNMSILAQVQATFALIRKHKQYGRSAIDAFRQGQQDDTYQRPISGKTQPYQQLPPGAIIDTNEFTDYELPSANVNASGLVGILQAELRAVAARLIMPEWMLSVDASNNNFSCHDSATECLTARGWLRYDQLRYGDLIGTMSPESQRFEWQPVRAIHVHDYDGEMVRLQGHHNLDLLVTPNHRMYVTTNQNRRRNGKMVREGLKPWHFVRADELQAGMVLPFSCLPMEGEPASHFTIPAVKHARFYKDEASHPQPRDVPMGAFLSFLGWWVSEGWTVGRPKGGHPVGIAQTARFEKECDSIRAAITGTGYSHGEYSQGNGVRCWVINDKSLWSWLRANCGTGSYTKRLPPFVHQLPASQTAAMLDALVMGDGTEYKSGSLGYFSVSGQLADGVQALAIQNGYVSHRNAPMANGVIPVTIKRPTRFLRVAARHISRVPYRGVVWCVTVDNGLVVTRRGGKAIITGNSSLIAEAPSTRNFERLQSYYGGRWGDGPKAHAVLWRVLEIAASWSVIPREILTDCVIQAEPPPLVVRNKQAETARAQVLKQNGVISPHTWAKWEGLDLQQEKALGARDEAGQQPDAGPHGKPKALPPKPDLEKPAPPGAALAGYREGEEGPPFAEAMTWEGCVANRTGKGHHDDETGHPCSTGPAGGNGNGTGEKTGPAGPIGSPSLRPGELEEIAAASQSPEGRLSLFGQALAAWNFVAEKGMSLYAGVQAIGQALYDRLPRPAQLAVSGVAYLGNVVHHALDVGKEAAQRLALEAASERGLSDEHVEAVGKVARLVDGFLAWTTNVPVVHHVLERRVPEHAAHLSGPLGFAIAKMGFFVPIGSLAYLAVSTAANPLATARAAWKVLTLSDAAARRAMPQAAHEAEERPLCGQELMGELQQRLADAGDNSEWYLALWCAALETSHDSRKALASADLAFEAYPSADTSSLAPEDFTGLIAGYQPPAPYSSEVTEGVTWEELLEAEQSSKDRKVGDRWQGPSGRWFTKRADGRVVPAKGQGGAEKPKATPTAQEAGQTLKGHLEAGKPLGGDELRDLGASLKGMKLADIRSAVKAAGIDVKDRSIAGLVDKVLQKVRAGKPAGKPAPRPKPAEKPKPAPAPPPAVEKPATMAPDAFRSLIDASRKQAGDRAGAGMADKSAAQKLGEVMSQAGEKGPVSMSLMQDMEDNINPGLWPGGAGGEAHTAANEAYASLLRRVPDDEFAQAAKSGGIVGYVPHIGSSPESNTYPAAMDTDQPGLAAVLRDRLGAKPRRGK